MANTKRVMKRPLGGCRMMALLGTVNDGRCRGGGGYQRLFGHRA